MATATVKRKKNERSYEDKLKIIDFCEQNSNMKKKDIALHFDIAQSIIWYTFQDVFLGGST